MIGTSKEEQKKRQAEFQKIRNQFNAYNEKIHELWRREKEDEDTEAGEERDKLLESPEYEALLQELSFGPRYDYLLADLEDPDYLDAFGSHPLNSDNAISQEYNKGIYGARVCFEGKYYGVVECLAYDYGDYYYKLRPDDNPDEPMYFTMCEPYTRYTEGTGEIIEKITKTTKYYTNKTYAANK